MDAQEAEDFIKTKIVDDFWIKENIQLKEERIVKEEIERTTDSN